ncbi:MAG: DHH family phosphoesterase [ANME-2 cluster archaeon]|nr:DHH family phosphoesterase [ANME-2 cluster archaeon]
MTSALLSLGHKVAKVLEGYSFIRIISHNDTDGITAAGIMSSACLRSNIIFQTSIVSALNQQVIDRVNSHVYGKSGAVLFCDMGSGQPELMDQVEDDVIIIDHHQIVGDHNGHVQINPMMVNIDGSRFLSASGTAYYVARAMGNNVDLAGLALAGAVGDKQKMEQANADILREAVERDVVCVRPGLRVPDGDVAEVLLTLTEPYLDTAGDKAATKQFLDEMGISGTLQDMEMEELARLASALALKIAGRADLAAVQSLVGDVLVLNREVVSNIYSLEWMLNCCGKVDQPALGLSLCMRDASVLDEVRTLSSRYQQTVVEQVRSAQALVKDMEHIRYVVLEDVKGTGLIGGTLIRYVCPDKPFITLNKVEDMVKVSARGTRSHVDRGLNLAVAMREASAGVGGQGGGHDIASGASIPPGTTEEFLKAVNSIVGGQLA